MINLWPFGTDPMPEDHKKGTPSWDNMFLGAPNGSEEWFLVKSPGIILESHLSLLIFTFDVIFR